MILDLCGGTGMWSKPYKDDGYDVRVLTLPDFDVTKWREYEWLTEAIKNNETSKGAKDFVSCVEHYADLKDIPEGYLEKTGYTKREVMRSMTPLGFAEAFYKANKY